MFIAQFFKASSLKKIRSITFMVWVLGRVEKNAKKKVKKMLTFFFCLKQILKCDSCFYTYFSRAFQKYSFHICSFSHKKVIGYFRVFFTHSGLLTALYPTLCMKKKFFKNFKIWHPWNMILYIGVWVPNQTNSLFLGWASKPLNSL